jgi:hypothetical protein
MLTRLAITFGIAALATAAAAQQMYRWVDENGRTHITDTPPPASAKGVNKVKPGAPPAAGVPLALQTPMRDFPVTLYSSSDCAEPCAMARAHLNKRGIPFTETPIRDGVDELKRLAPGANQVPALRVGGQVLSGFEAQAYDGALDSAGYPRAGVLAPRAQRAPAEAGEGPPKPEAAKPDESAPQGPYAPGSRPQRQQQKK